MNKRYCGDCGASVGNSNRCHYCGGDVEQCNVAAGVLVFGTLLALAILATWRVFVIIFGA